MPITRDSNNRIVTKTLSYNPVPGVVNNAASLGTTGNTDVANINVLTLSGTTVTATGAEINSISNIVGGTASANKFLKLDANKDISGINSLSCASLTVNGTSITSGGSSLPSEFTGITNGTAAASKALVLDSSSNITGINSFSCTSLTVNGTSITGSASLPSEFTGITNGTAAASKALVLDSSKNITGINDLMVTSFNVNNYLTIANNGAITGVGSTFSTSLNAGGAFGHQNSYNPASSNVPLTLTLRNNSTNNYTPSLVFQNKNSASNYVPSALIIPYMTVNTANSEASGLDFFCYRAGTSYRQFSILSTGGCQVMHPGVSSTTLALTINPSTSFNTNDYQDLAFEAANNTYGRIRNTGTNVSSRTAKFDFLLPFGGTEYTAFTIAGNNSGGDLSNINTITAHTLTTDSAVTTNGALNINGSLTTKVSYLPYVSSNLGFYAFCTYDSNMVSTNPFSVPNQAKSTSTRGSLSINYTAKYLFLTEAAVQPTYNETYTISVTYVTTYFKLWINEKLVLNQTSINSSSTNTLSTTYVFNNTQKYNIKMQIIMLASGTTNTCELRWSSASQVSQVIPFYNCTNNISEFVKERPFAAVDMLTLYSMMDSSTSVNKTELTSDSSGNFAITPTGGNSTINSNVGIGKSPAYQLELSSDSAAKPSSNTWTVTSDMRLKENIIDADLDLCYNNIKTLKLRQYKWKDDIYSVEQVKDRTKLGWIAQEVEPIFPKAVDTISANGLDDCKTLNADQIMASLYGSVQKLMNMVETLQNDKNILQNKINKIEEFINNLEITEN